jgi:DNA-binding transcriptional LysR family regulator
MEITPRVLRSFLVLAEEQHFHRAAERLFITSSALSQQIRQLEGTLKVPLFDRTSRSVTLTTHGVRLIPLAQRVLDAVADITTWAQEEQSGRRVLRVGSMSAGTGRLWESVLPAVTAALPDLDVLPSHLDWGDQFGPLLRGDVDLAFVRDPAVPDGLHALTVDEERRVVLLPSDHPLATRDEVTFAEIADDVFLPSATGSQEWKNLWLVVPRPDGGAPRLGPAVSSIEDVLELVAAGHGINLASEGVSSFYSHPRVRFVPVSDLPPVPVRLVRPAVPTNPDVPRFERALREQLDRAPRHQGDAG